MAESTCDGIVAPLFFLAIGGAPLAWCYKAVNTLDSLVGHIEPPYRDFGWASARLDDAMNWIPARLTAWLIILAGSIRFRSLSRLRDGWATLMRDGGKHPSPNSGRPEAAMAGALGVQLGGINRYDGIAKSVPPLGQPHELLVPRRLEEAVTLMWMVFALAAGLASWLVL
jgi:adenosylcobinamide-phosphate synthase